VTGFDVAPEEIRAAADGIGGVVARLDEVLSQFEDKVLGFGRPWGTDDLGTLMGQCYLAIHDMAFHCYETNAATLDDFAGGLEAMADNYDAAEEDSLSAVERIPSVLDSTTPPR
jgi:hypothetical protein